MKEHEESYGKMNWEANAPIEDLFPGTYYLEGIDEKWRRSYKRKDKYPITSVSTSETTIANKSVEPKLFALSKM